MIRRVALPLAALAVFALASPGRALAADPGPEQRQKMAEAHQKMADCLRSTRPFAECHKEMTAACHDMGDAMGCPMMGKGHGGMGHGMMQEPPAPAPPESPKK